MLPGGRRIILCVLGHFIPGLDLYCTDPAKQVITAARAAVATGASG